MLDKKYFMAGYFAGVKLRSHKVKSRQDDQLLSAPKKVMRIGAHPVADDQSDEDELILDGGDDDGRNL